MIANLGLLAGLALLVILALRGVNILIAALLGSLVVALTNGLSIPATLLEHWPYGPPGAFAFAGSFFMLFLAGAVFGKVMAESKAAISIAYALAEKLGARRTLWIVMIATAILTYGGVVVFVVIFTIYPLGLALIKQADIPKRLLAGAAALGAGTFTMTALPGAPSVHNVIAATSLNTSLFAAPVLGLFAAALMIGIGMWYLERSRLAAAKQGDGFVIGPLDVIPETSGRDPTMPHWLPASLPLMVVLGTIVLPRILIAALGGEVDPDGPPLHQILYFADTQNILWPTFALVLGATSGALLFPLIRANPMATISRGAEDSVMPLLNTAAVIGFGGVVVQTDGFLTFAEAMLGSGLPPLLSAIISVSIVSAIVGSSSGGLQIFMDTLAERYLAMGIEPETLHRVVTIAAGGIDSLPHSGAVVATLTIMQLTHRQAYGDIFAITVVVPVIVTFIVLGVVMVL